MSGSDLVVREWTEEEWLRSRESWNALLADSQADPLFLSWDWQRLWWETYRSQIGARLLMLAAYRGSRLLGIAPFYSVRARRARVIPALSVQLMGMHWRDPDVLISEYLDVLAMPEHYVEVRRCCTARAWEQSGCVEMVVANVDGKADWHGALAAGSTAARAAYVRQVDQAASYQADLSRGFSAYVGGLGASTRRSVLNLRSRLRARGAVALEVADAADLDGAFDDLNRLHAQRWGVPVYGGARLDFHRQFARRAAAGRRILLSRLTVAGQTVSVLHDVRVGGRQYNLQMGFDPAFERGVSLGLLHLGYAMEQAVDAGIKVYDFLAGWGRTTDYKRHLGQRQRLLCSVQSVRGSLLPRLYRWHDGRSGTVRRE